MSPPHRPTMHGPKVALRRLKIDFDRIKEELLQIYAEKQNKKCRCGKIAEKVSLYSLYSKFIQCYLPPP